MAETSISQKKLLPRWKTEKLISNIFLTQISGGFQTVFIGKTMKNLPKMDTKIADVSNHRGLAVRCEDAPVRSEALGFCSFAGEEPMMPAFQKD